MQVSIFCFKKKTHQKPILCRKFLFLFFWRTISLGSQKICHKIKIKSLQSDMALNGLQFLQYLHVQEAENITEMHQR
jgi:hypothetical protein